MYESPLSNLTESKVQCRKMTGGWVLDSNTPLDDGVTPSPPWRHSSLPTDALVKRDFNTFNNSSYSHFEIHNCWKMILICIVFGLDTFSRHDLTSLAGRGTNSFEPAFGLKELRVKKLVMSLKHVYASCKIKRQQALCCTLKTV